MIKQKIAASLIVIITFLSTSAPALANNQQAVQVSQKVGKKKITQTIIINQKGNNNLAEAYPTLTIDQVGSKVKKIVQKIKITQKGNNNNAIATPEIYANLGSNSPKISQKVKIKQKGHDNQATANPKISLNN